MALLEPLRGASDPDPEYDLARAQWRANLSELDVRALAYEYKTGNIDDCTEDAWLEYRRRFGGRVTGPQTEFLKKPNASATSMRKRRKLAP